MDEIVRMMTGDGAVKATAITGKELTERARQIHKTLPVATLCRTARGTCGAMCRTAM